ncbi:MAG TPA: SpoIID/LytB domain-containing protein [Acidimicrobiales bacterium]|nr:SpoIID/LytB domain-containing protein [Acidimicrobiales bacterium]
MHFRRFVAGAVASLTVVAGAVFSAPPAAAAVPETFTFTGSGFGHGVGMSQYGAFGQAQEGRTAAQILQHYYSGVTVGAFDDAVALRVNLLDAATSVQMRGESLATGGGAIKVVADAATIDAGDKEAVTFGIAGTNVTASKAGGAPISAAVVKVQWSAGPTLLDVIGGTESFDGPSHRYRYGEVDVAVVAGKLVVVNTLSLHQEYLRGIAEVPSSWPAEALKAQVIAARTYALYKFQAGERAACRCHVYDSISDQVFAGWSKESEPTFGAKWVDAVAATSPSTSTGITVLSGGEPIGAFYYSSSGGKTESNTDGFGSSTPFSYLKSVDDRWSLLVQNPFASWTFTRTQADVLEAFNRDLAADKKLRDVESLDLSARTAGGSLKTAVATAADGTRASIGGNTFRSRLELPARWIGTPVVRVSGPDRYSTGVAIGRQAASASGGTVVVVSGENAHLVDGLVAAPLARLRQAPLLLSEGKGLPQAVADEVARRKPQTAILVGGLGALSAQVEDDLEARGVTTVRRLAGADRYETGLLVARDMQAPRTQVVIASGEAGHLVDALAAGGPAAATARPVLLVARDQVPFPTRQALTEMGTTSTVVAGGEAAVSDATMSQLPSPRRLAGDSRYSTATAIADFFASTVGTNRVVVASGADGALVDALAGGALASLTVLTAPEALTAVTRTWLTSGAGAPAGLVHVLGGPAAVGNATFDSLRSAVY